MSRGTREFKVFVVRCDMTTCDVEIVSEEKPKESPLSVIAINGHQWDFCPTCYERILPILDFLSTEVGVPFKFKVIK